MHIILAACAVSERDRLWEVFPQRCLPCTSCRQLLQDRHVKRDRRDLRLTRPKAAQTNIGHIVLVAVQLPEITPRPKVHDGLGQVVQISQNQVASCGGKVTFGKRMTIY